MICTARSGLDGVRRHNLMGPGPRHVLELGGQLGLTDQQRADVQRLFAARVVTASSLGNMSCRLRDRAAADEAARGRSGEALCIGIS